MPIVTAVRATAQPNIDQRDLVVIPPTPTILLRLLRRRHIAFLHLLQTLLISWIRHRVMERQWINPTYQRQETIPERVARTEPYLYIRSLSG
jgi:hypothetical protein